ncbi:hypothetical protein ACFE04_030869 [Oxalis oulophora]
MKGFITSPSFHGGRGALPSAGGHPADLTFLAGVAKQLQHDDYLSMYDTPEHQLKDSPLAFQVPVYYIGSQSSIENTPFGVLPCIPEEGQSLLDVLLLSEWEDRMQKGCFKYDVTASELKVVEGQRKFIVQSNEGWKMNYPSKDTKVCHHRNSLVFDFPKNHKELLFWISSSEKENSELIPSAAGPSDAISVLVNVNPIEYGHVFLIPNGSTGLHSFPNVLSLEMVLRVAVEVNNKSFRLFYDHYTPHISYSYFQACYFSNLLPVELMPRDTFFNDAEKGVRISSMRDYPIKTLIFESTIQTKAMIEIISELCAKIQSMNVPYNLLISECGKNIFLFLQNVSTSCGISSWECGGYFMFKSRFEFDRANEEDMLQRMVTASLDDEGFLMVKQLCCSIACKTAI